MKYLDLNSWKRKNHFNFFSKYEDPYWGVTSIVDCSKMYHSVKEQRSSLFLYYLYKSLLAANQVKALRLRIDAQDRVEIHDQIHAASTVNRPDGTFGFSYMPFSNDQKEFIKLAKMEIEKVQALSSLEPDAKKKNVIHYSSLPWLDFSSISHARQFKKSEGIPKISFGKITRSDGKKYSLPVSIHVDHALVDGIDVAKFFELFEAHINE